MLNFKGCSFLPPPRILTFGRIFFSFLAVFVLTVFVNAQTQPKVVRFNNGTQTASGTNIRYVQITTTVDGAPADGDVIKIYDTPDTCMGLSLNDDDYFVRTFTVESADGNKKTVTAVEDTQQKPTLYRNYLLKSKKTKTYNLTFNNLDYEGTNEAIAHFGLFLHESVGDADLTINLNNVSFTKFKGNDTNGYGGVIHSKSPVKINGSNDVSFTQNEGTGGGAIYIASGDLTVNIGGNLSFDSNKAIGTDPVQYPHAGDGGAIYIENGSVSLTNAQEVSFTNNTSTYSGGALYFTQNATIKANTINFSSNISNLGGAIHGNGNGTGTLSIEGNSITFANNTAVTSGGAIYSNTSVTFSGDATSAEFSGNTAAAGNDLYLDASSGTVLSFTDSGTYSFNGGIFVNNVNAQTVINQAQVTIAGRQYKPVANAGDPLVEDTTNNYQLRNVTISEGGKLTAKLDNIDKIENTTITLNGTESQVELYNVLLNQVASIKSNTGDGTFDLVYSAVNGAVQNESLVISSGRIDVKGYMLGGITVDANGVFSPGNSVGEAKFGGGYELYDGAKLLIEMDETGVDSLIASSFNETNGIIELAIDGIPFGTHYDVITATNGFSGTQDEAYWLGKFGTLPDYMTLSVVDGVYGANSQTVRFSIDRNAVPEPSTWALLILGAAGLMYVRKRSK